jgi:outer membrane protein assembly factor BamD (BamD/ComL family)
MFGSDKLPCIVGANEDATELFDEVLALMPSHEYGAQALYAKGLHLRNLGLYRESVEAFQRLLKQFPDHPDTPGAYIAIVETYLQQAHAEHHNPDVLVLADINIRRFKEAFPRDERVIHCADKLMEIKEIHAKGLFQIGQFYERMKHPQASLIYYANAIRRFPDTQTAVDCKKRLHALKEEGSDYNLPKEWML